MVELLAALLLLAGSAVVLVAAVGVARLPDTFLRMHASTKAGAVGSGLVLIGTALAFGGGDAWVRALVILGFLLATTPVAANALGRAAYVGGAPLWTGTVADQLAGVLPRGTFDPVDAGQRRRALQPTAEEEAAPDKAERSDPGREPAPPAPPSP
ncbi:hypothetical protein GCM10010964_29890 [Caldovatus sediminis]|uniref:Na+/H+ antiporter subunit G n=1 Tax=Caldovatus sediminis TaxID=2041189 RepID=A0A8J2ZD68_9PROT|nr:monovalent cation/H(+) antiporter subunit G [Caldovatus sediminis]GGG40312.1 hypothetical protein GCM10010964_29890 [Caldovatus sediminis]